jgi:hypothetical protein
VPAFSPLAYGVQQVAVQVAGDHQCAGMLQHRDYVGHRTGGHAPLPADSPGSVLRGGEVIQRDPEEVLRDWWQLRCGRQAVQLNP